MTSTPPYIPVSVGELFDKYTILQIKLSKINNQSKLDIIQTELFYLQKQIDRYCNNKDFIDELRMVNEELWNIEDNIRELESKQMFNDRFVDNARKVYFTNDRRSEIKKRINEHYHSVIHEVKSYSTYEKDNIP